MIKSKEESGVELMAGLTSPPSSLLAATLHRLGSTVTRRGEMKWSNRAAI
ncbi:MAG: hypothetical protein AB1631_10210 [Acidobacteriota bacterium]